MGREEKGKDIKASIDYQTAHSTQRPNSQNLQAIMNSSETLIDITDEVAIQTVTGGLAPIPRKVASHLLILTCEDIKAERTMAATLHQRALSRHIDCTEFPTTINVTWRYDEALQPEDSSYTVLITNSPTELEYLRFASIPAIAKINADLEIKSTKVYFSKNLS